MHRKTSIKHMKKAAGIFILLSILFSACSMEVRKPYYKTAEGKKKQKYYNELQFGGKTASTTKKTFK
jgi:hypothetical protein